MRNAMAMGRVRDTPVMDSPRDGQLSIFPRTATVVYLLPRFIYFGSLF